MGLREAIGHALIEKAQELLKKLSEKYPEYGVVEADNNKIAELEVLKLRTNFLMQAARAVFGKHAHSVTTSRDEEYPSQLFDEGGKLIAFCWIDDGGHPNFMPWDNENAN